ncbi:MAG: copper homeostasis protein CutC [Firmicutes bacterium]|nr:copper homeostasis protein CutC [Bacillota bacterium]
MGYTLECCVDSVESAIAAKKGGADRIELCSALVIGGLSPSQALYRKIREQVDLPIRVLLRPRFGDFCYTDFEHEIIKEEIRSFRKLGADGIVIGTMKPDGTLNVEQMKKLIEEAQGMSVTLHRAFDMCKNPFMALEEARKLGINTILTSGQKNTCIDGVELLKELVEKAQGETEILVGGGVDASVLPVLAEKTKAKAYHMSGKISMESEMRYRKQDVSMGIASVSEYEIWRTSEKRVREARKILDEL